MQEGHGAQPCFLFEGNDPGRDGVITYEQVLKVRTLYLSLTAAPALCMLDGNMRLRLLRGNVRCAVPHVYSLRPVFALQTTIHPPF